MAGRLPTIASFWHGPMSWLEQLSVASFVRAGHAVDVYAYERPEGFAEGANLRDAGEILGREHLVFYKGKGTPGVFSDYFRMSLMKAGRGIWADLDMYCVRPIADPPEYLMSYERAGSVNGAVLRIPAEAPLLADLLSVFTERRRPLLEPHLPMPRRIEVAVRRLAGQRVNPEDMQYGATGPFALTHYVKKHGLEHLVLPHTVFYPIAYEQIPPLMRAGSSIDAFVRADTLGVHIWRSQLTRRGRAGMPAPEPRSALAELCRREGIVP